MFTEKRKGWVSIWEISFLVEAAQTDWSLWKAPMGCRLFNWWRVPQKP